LVARRPALSRLYRRCVRSDASDSTTRSDDHDDRGPRKLSFAWPLAKDDRSVVPTVAYGLYPKGPQTAVHVTHHSPEAVAGDWGTMWQQTLELLKSYLETPQPASDG